jgi:imidazole glycerol-phosphate synthase subunit HisH
MGNISSVRNAFDRFSVEIVLAERAEEAVGFDAIVLPGVGAFAQGMHELQSRGWVSFLRENVAERKVPFLGFCIGMQLLAQAGEEHGRTEGLGLIPGTVRSIQDFLPGARVPHMGWNDIKVAEGKSPVLFREFQRAPDFYFANSFVFEPKGGKSFVSSTFSYEGAEFVASLESDNIHATQFHPEKSQFAGLGVLDNFLSFVQSRC